MKKEIVNRIKQLGGNVANVKGVSLQEDLCAITFNTALYQKPEDTPWLSAEDTEPIEGLGDWVDENMELFNSDRETFYKKMVDTYYTLDEEPRGQLFWVAKPFTPFQKGTQDGMIGFQMMQSWTKSFNIQIATLLPLWNCFTQMLIPITTISVCQTSMLIIRLYGVQTMRSFLQRLLMKEHWKIF